MKYVRYLLIVFALTVLWMTYDNVFSDEVPIRALAQQAACTVKKCDERHDMTKMGRTPIGQSFEFTWKDGTVAVTCHREYWVVGERKCTVD